MPSLLPTTVSSQSKSSALASGSKHNAQRFRFAEEGLTIIAEFVDVETGKGADALDRRPQLAAAREARPAVVRCRVRRPRAHGTSAKNKNTAKMTRCTMP